MNALYYTRKSTTEQTCIKRCDVEEGYCTQKWMNPPMLSMQGHYIQRHSRAQAIELVIKIWDGW